MALYDNYFTNEDKPFAENLNDALLVSNVFDFTVPIVLPTMFSNNTWVDTTSPRKCGVAIATLKEALPSGISVGTSGGNSTLTGTGTVKLLFYPNFNTFGKFKAINWESSNNKIQVNLKKKNGTSIASNISKGNLSVNITDLEELLIEIVFTASDTLTSFTITMENKDSSTRYGADVKIQSVDGLETRLTNIESKNTSQDTAINGKVDKVTNKGLSSNDFTTAYKNKIDGLSTVATSGSYSDLSNKPTIPTKTSQLTNDGDGTNVFVKNNDSRLTNSRTPTSHTHGNLTNAGAIGSASGKIITTTTSGVLTASDTITKSKISDFPSTMTPTSHTHGNLTNAGAIGSSSGQIITTTTNGVLTASSTITKSKISDFPTSMTPTSHTHGSVSNDGKIGSSSGKLIVTGNNGVLSAVDNIDKSKVSNFNKEVVDIVYPIGSIYMSVNSTSPSILFGGTWEQLKDKFLLASGDTYSNGATGGSADATLVSHQHGTSESGEYFVTSEIETANNTTVSYNSNGNRIVDGQLSGGSSFHHRIGTGYVGSSATGKNMPPYLVVNVWKRTA
ncbi:MAG: hypothetical protein IJI96_03625 [Methanobrevibacter sp.]|nr:hypothetical protein [Methanobrevibacter sp.]